MMLYALVQNEKVVEIYGQLPESFNNISGFHTLPKTDLVKYGFYEFHEIIDDLLFDEKYGDIVDEISDTRVTRIHTKIKQTKTELFDKLTGIKQKKIEDLDLTRKSLSESSVNVNGNMWQADVTSRTLLSNAILVASHGYDLPPFWRTTDNKNIPITDISELLDIASAIDKQTHDVSSKYWEIKDKIIKSSSADEMELL
jgi:hypothetical protein